MAHICIGMRASHLLATSLSSRRPATKASARPTCLTHPATPPKFCRSFQPGNGLHLLFKKPAGPRSIASRQVMTHSSTSLKISSTLARKLAPSGVCRGRGLGRKHGKRGSYIKVRCHIHLLSGRQPAAKRCTLQASWLDQLLGSACSVNSICNHSVICSIILYAGKPEPCFGLGNHVVMLEPKACS